MPKDPITGKELPADDKVITEPSQELIGGKFKTNDDLLAGYKELEKMNTELATEKADVSRELATELSGRVLSARQPNGGQEITAEIDLTDPQQLASYLDERDRRYDATLDNLADFTEIMAKDPTLSREQAIKIMERKGNISAGDLAELELLRKEKLAGTLGKTEEKTLADKVISELDKSLGGMQGGDTGLEELNPKPYDYKAWAALSDEERAELLRKSSEEDYAAMPESMKS